MDISDVHTVFTTEIETGRSPTISIPEQELRIGNLETGKNYRVAILPPVEKEAKTQDRQQRRGAQDTPIEEGETLQVEIEDIGEKGDGVARIGPGLIVFVPSTNIGDRPMIEITDVRENFAFGEVVEPEPLTS